MLISISGRPRWREKEEQGGSSSVGGRQGREEDGGEGGEGAERGRLAGVKGCYTCADIFAGLREGDTLIAVSFSFLIALKG